MSTIKETNQNQAALSALRGDDMKREIKFRGKRVDNGEWVFGDLYQETDNKRYRNIVRTTIVEHRPDLMLVSGASSNNQWWREVDPETIGQYTGMKDKNGVEIYEGDILYDTHNRRSLDVEYRYAAFTVSSSHRLSFIAHNGIEVIGNIHVRKEGNHER